MAKQDLSAIHRKYLNTHTIALNCLQHSNAMPIEEVKRYRTLLKKNASALRMIYRAKEISGASVYVHS